MTEARTYGALEATERGWLVRHVEPHVALKLKAVFPRIPKHERQPFLLTGGHDLSADLAWFLQRYPMELTESDRTLLAERKSLFDLQQDEIASILDKDWKPSTGIRFRPSSPPYHYQSQAAEIARRFGNLLLMDDVGLGKTVSALATVALEECLPAAIVVQAHLADQWVDEITDFTQMVPHIIKRTTPYALPRADIYIFKYSNIAGWIDYIATSGFKSVVFDEIQELRSGGFKTAKGRAAQAFVDVAGVRMGLTATPIYNYGDEIFNIVEFLRPGALGTRDEFLTEWCTFRGSHWIVKDPQALGAFLREQMIAVRRVESDVRKEMPPVNTIIQTVPYDEEVAAESEDLARQLAITVTTAQFHESGQAAREFNALMRHTTGVAKAKHVAAYVRMLLESGRKVLLAGWHREVYDIWNRELARFAPVMFTGSESPKQKRKTREAFINGGTNLMIMSLRSGTGLNGLQHVCYTAVVGELDWSPQVHKQFIGRLRRPGQQHQVDAIYLVADGGADPTMVATLGLKSDQSRGIVDPFAPAEQQHSDVSRIKALAEAYLAGERLPVAPETSAVALGVESVVRNVMGGPAQASLF